MLRIFKRKAVQPPQATPVADLCGSDEAFNAYVEKHVTDGKQAAELVRLLNQTISDVEGKSNRTITEFCNGQRTADQLIDGAFRDVTMLREDLAVSHPNATDLQRALDALQSHAAQVAEGYKRHESGFTQLSGMMEAGMRVGLFDVMRKRVAFLIDRFNLPASIPNSRQDQRHNSDQVPSFE